MDKALELAALRAALSLSGYIGQGIEIVGHEPPEDVYFALVEALGIPEADDANLREVIRARTPNAVLQHGGGGA